MKFDSEIYWKIIKLGLPILVGQLGMIVTGFADTMMVGHYSTAALAASSFVNNLFNVAAFACIGFTYGVTPLVGALYGQGAERRADIGAMVKTALIVNIIFSLVVTGIMCIVYHYLDRLGQPPELLPIIRPYYKLYLAGMVTFALFGVFAQWSYGINDTRTPMWAILGSNVINVTGNSLLIFGLLGFPELGLTGAGIATLTARCFVVAWMLYAFFLRRKNTDYRHGFFHKRFTRERWGLVNRTSWPVALQMAFESGSFSAAAVMTGWLGAIPLAAMQMIIIVGTLGFCVYYSMASAVAVLVSNEAGRSDKAAMRRTARAGYIIILCMAAVASLIFALAGRHMMLLFSDDQEVIALAVTLIVPLVLYQLGDATQINYANALRGTSNVMPMLWIAFASYVIVGIPATYLLGFTAGLGVYGVVLSFSVSLFMAAGLFLWKFMTTTRPTTEAQAS